METNTANTAVAENPRTMVVIWRWNEAALSPLHPLEWDQWKTSNGNIFLRACWPNSPESLGQIRSVIQEVLPEKGEVLVFLHSSPPHNYTDFSRKQLAHMLYDLTHINRVRLFGDGHGPIYFSFDNEKGILGSGGDFPVLADSEEEDPVRVKKSDFVLVRKEKYLNEEQYKFVWECYWNDLWTIISRLKEDLQWWQMNQPILPAPATQEIKKDDSLYKQKGLWHKLAQFANREDLMYNTEAAISNKEYQLIHFTDILKEKNLSREVSELSRIVGQFLEGLPTGLENPAQYIFEKLSEIQRKLTDEKI